MNEFKNMIDKKKTVNEPNNNNKREQNYSKL